MSELLGILTAGVIAVMLASYFSEPQCETKVTCVALDEGRCTEVELRLVDKKLCLGKFNKRLGK